MGIDYYGLLGVPRDATPEEIRRAYFEAARQLHPDANPNPNAKEDFLQIQDAYDVLSDPERRSIYDASLSPDLGSQSVSVNIRYSRSIIPRLDEPQLLYAMLEIVCNATPDANSLPPAHICLVLDRSTSMQGDRMDMVKASTALLIKQLRPRDLLSVVSFSDRAEVVIPPTEVTALPKMDNRINLIQTGGATEIFQGLNAGVTLLRRNSSARYIRQLILLTDGHTYGDDQPCLELAKQAAAEGIFISALGIGHEWNDSFLDAISCQGGGNAAFVTSPKDLYNYLEQKLNSIEMLFARGVSLEFQSDQYVELKYAFKLQPELSPLPTTSPIPLGDLLFGKNISILFEFLVKPLNPTIAVVKLLEGKVRMESPSQAAGVYRSFVDASRPVQSTLEKERPPQAIIEAMSKLTLYRMQEKARQEVESGDLIHATQHLHHLATHLLARGDRALAHTVLVEAEHIQQSHHFSLEGDKRIKYGTRALLLLPGGPPKGEQ